MRGKEPFVVLLISRWLQTAIVVQRMGHFADHCAVLKGLITFSNPVLFRINDKPLEGCSPRGFWCLFQAIRELLFIDPSRHHNPNDRHNRYLQHHVRHEILKRIVDLEQKGLHEGILHLSEARGAATSGSFTACLCRSSAFASPPRHLSLKITRQQRVCQVAHVLWKMRLLERSSHPGAAVERGSVSCRRPECRSADAARGLRFGR
jgi:hypothetical protein